MFMFKYICKRVGLAIVNFAIIFIMLFTLMKLLPVDTTSVGIGEDANKIIQQMVSRGYMKYDENTASYVNTPVIEQFGKYMKRIFLEGDFGIGVNIPQYRGRQVFDVFIEKLPASLLINLYSSILAVPIGLALGIYAALKKNKWQDQAISTGVMIVISVPAFVYASLLLFLVCFKAGWFPIGVSSLQEIVEAYPEKGFEYIPGKPNWSLYFTGKMFKSMFPAVLAASFGSIAGYARTMRAELTEVLTSEFMLLARTKGLTKSQATLRHAMRNSMVPIFPSILGEIIALLYGSIVLEKIFAVPGLGGLTLMALNTRDVDFYMMVNAFYTIVGLLSGVVMDLSYGMVDPRIRMGAR